MKTLILARHADAADTPEGGDDHDRELTPTGRIQARRLRQILGEGTAPEVVLCSSAKRAVETVAGFRVSGSALADADLRVEPELYLASAEAIRGRLDWIDDDVKTLMVVAHNPGIGLLAHQLAAVGDGRETLVPGFPPAAVAVFEADVVRWLSLRSGRLARFEAG